jgi:two-component system NtrC family sensor kinase
MKILSADDDLTSRMLLKANLARWGYEVISVEDGSQAWERLAADPELRFAILDWMMPGSDGIDLCRRLADNELGRFVYTILLTSRAEKKDIVAGLEAGAHDFLSKPFNPAELRSRVQVGCRILAYEQDLAQANQRLENYAVEMEALAAARATQLVHSERLATLGTMSAGIAHEINNPTSFISGNVQTLDRFWQVVQEQIDWDGGQDPEQLEFIRTETPRILKGIQEGVGRISRIVKGLKSFSARDRGELTCCQVNDSITNALELANNTLKTRVTVEQDLQPDLPVIRGNGQELEQVFVNLFVNAAQAMPKNRMGLLRVATRLNDKTVCITVEDDGPGIPAELLNKIWDPFFTTKSVGEGTGLGLAITLGIIERHSGRITAENRPGGGACFQVRLPAAERTTGHGGTDPDRG